MRQEELEPEVTELDTTKAARHVFYPQRLPQFSLGSHSNWGWMQHLGTTPSIGNWSADTIDWLSRFQQVFANAEPGCPTTIIIMEA